MKRDFETLYYEQQANFTESNGMLEQENARLAAALAEGSKRIAELETRLEIHPEAPAYDGIACRDETIRLQDERIAKLAPYAGELSTVVQRLIDAYHSPGQHAAMLDLVAALAKNPNPSGNAPEAVTPEGQGRQQNSVAVLTSCVGPEGAGYGHETCTEPVFRVEPDSGLWFVTFDGCPEPSVQAFADEDRAHALAHCLNATVAPLMLRHQSCTQSPESIRPHFGWWDHFNEEFVRTPDDVVRRRAAGNKVTPLYIDCECGHQVGLTRSGAMDYNVMTAAFLKWMDERPAGYPGPINPAGTWFDAFVAGCQWRHAINSQPSGADRG